MSQSWKGGNENIIIEPQSTALIPTGISLELPAGFEAQVRSRSGLALKNDYGKNIIAAGPAYKSHEIKGKKNAKNASYILENFT